MGALAVSQPPSARVAGMVAKIDNEVNYGGNLPSGITTSTLGICRSGVGVDCTGLANLNVLTGSYVVGIPADR